MQTFPAKLLQNLYKFLKIKMQRQNHNSSHKTISILLLYIMYFPVLIKFILVSDLLSEALVL